MHCAHRTLCLAGGLSLAILGGCYSYYPTRPMGGPTYSAPPAGVVVPQGPPGQFFQPGLTPQMAPPTGGQPQWQAPSPGPDTGSWDPAANPNPVPNYGDPQDLNAPPTFGPSGQKGSPTSPSGYNAGKVELNSDTQVVSADGFEDFKPPMTIQQVSASQETVESEPEAPAVAGPNPFDYDHENYTWLRGTVEFDPEEKAWHIMYSENPDEKDAFGGDIALIDHPQLATLRDNDVVLLMGRIDPESRDDLGKPRYRIERASKVIPRKE